MSLLQLSEKELRDMVAKQEKPMLVRILAKAMLSWKGFDIIEKMLDRGIGKAKIGLEHTWEVAVNISSVIIK